MKKLLTIGLSLTALTLSACSTKISPETRTYYNQTQTQLQKESVSVLSTACILKVNVSKNHVLFMQSEGAGQAIANTLNSALASENLKVANVYTPFVCGAIENNYLQNLKIKATDDSKAELITTTPIKTSTNQFDESTNTAFQSLLMALNKVKSSNDSTITPVSLSLDSSSIATLKSTLQTNKVFIAYVNGTKQSFASSMATSTLSVVSPLAGAMVTPANGSFYSVALVDLNTNQVLWKKRTTPFNGNVFKLPIDNKFNIPTALEPLYEK